MDASTESHRSAPATDEALARVLERLAGGLAYRAALEELLLELEEQRAAELMLLHRESRAAWLPLLATARGRALFVGNAFAGTIPSMAFLGFDLTVLDPSVGRLGFSRFRDGEYVPGRTSYVAGGSAARLPFADGSFDLVVQEDGPPTPAGGWGHGVAELERVSRGEVLLVADNRLGYKRSHGRRGEFRVPGPLEYLREALGTPRGLRTLRGYRRIFGPAFAPPRAFALYPHARDYSHVVSLDAPRPRLTIGPRERRNLLKLAGKSLGLFPVLAPSFALIAARRARPAERPRIEIVLDELSELVGEPRPRLDILVATRSTDCLMHTAPAAGGPGTGAGYWTLHVPLSPHKKEIVRRHHRRLSELRARFPEVPVPEPLFEGEVGGMWLTCERRLGGLTAPHRTGDRRRTARMFRDAARDLSRLVVEPRARMDQALFEELVARSFRLVREHAAVESTRRALDRMLEQARERLLGRVVPLVYYHADLRAKHVQLGPQGEILGYLDWGAGLPRFLPYVDLLHLVAHQRQQEAACSPRRAWELVRERDRLRADEREPLEDYCRRVALDPEVRAAIEAMYPVLVAEMAERNWDYSRPRWLHELYGL